MQHRTLAAAGTAVTLAILATASTAAATTTPSPSPSPTVSTSASPSPTPSVSPSADPTPAPRPEIHAGIFAIVLGAGDAMPWQWAAVEDVVVGDGPELTAADVDADLSDPGACGDLEVDIDLDASTVTVTGTDPTCMALGAVVVVGFFNGPVLETVTLVSDGLFGGAATLDPVEVDSESLMASWFDPALATMDETSPLPTGLPLAGTSVFSLTFGDTLIEDLPVEEPEPGPVVDDMVEEALRDVAAEAAPAAPVTATPAFTG